MARLKNSADQQASRYVQGGTTDRYNNRLGWWERRELSNRDDDIIFVIPKSMEGRPDIISSFVYSHDQYAWLVLQYNNIVDPAIELYAGRQILLPAVSRLMLDILNQSSGGNIVK